VARLWCKSEDTDRKRAVLIGAARNRAGMILRVPVDVHVPEPEAMASRVMNAPRSRAASSANSTAGERALFLRETWCE